MADQEVEEVLEADQKPVFVTKSMLDCYPEPTKYCRSSANISDDAGYRLLVEVLARVLPRALSRAT